MSSIGPVALGLLLISTPLAAQTMRSTTVTRQRHAATELAARVEFAAGSVTLRPAHGSQLYRMELQYDADRFAPLSQYDAAGKGLLLGVRNVGNGGLRVSSKRHLQQSATIELSPDVSLSLDATFGAVEAGLDLGGLRLTDARIRTTASRTSLRFSRPNLAVCSSLEVDAGAAAVEIIGLGNSGCREVRVAGGVGEVMVDLTGDWPADARLVAEVAVGGLTLRVPRGLGVELRVDRFLASFNPAGFTRRGDSWISAPAAAGARTIRIDLKTTVGNISVEWVN